MDSSITAIITADPLYPSRNERADERRRAALEDGTLSEPPSATRVWSESVPRGIARRPVGYARRAEDGSGAMNEAHGAHRPMRRRRAAVLASGVSIAALLSSVLVLAVRDERTSRRLRSVTAEVAALRAAADLAPVRAQLSDLESAVPKLRTAIDSQDTIIADIQSTSKRDDLPAQVTQLADAIRNLTDCINVYIDAVAQARGGSYDYSLC